MWFRRKRGYKTFTDRNGREQFVHRRVVEKMLGEPIPAGQVVHHINGDKGDNRPQNLRPVTRGVHGVLHSGSPDACFRCGRRGHWHFRCYARTDYAGRRL